MSDTLTDPIPVGAKTQLIEFGDRGIITKTFEDAYRFAVAVVKSGLAPKHFDSPEKVMIAVQIGSEVGLSKMQSLQSIAVINGRACLWGDALPALVWGSGKCRDIIERFEGDRQSDDYTAVCEVHRIGKDTPTIGRFSIGAAKHAQLWNKPGPWKSYPHRMLQIRARTFAFRDAFADVLCGIGVAEEVRDIPTVEVDDAPLVTDGPARMLEATLTGKVGCKTPEDRQKVIDYLSRDYTESPDASQLLAELNRTAAMIPWDLILNHAKDA